MVCLKPTVSSLFVSTESERRSEPSLSPLYLLSSRSLSEIFERSSITHTRVTGEMTQLERTIGASTRLARLLVLLVLGGLKPSGGLQPAQQGESSTDSTDDEHEDDDALQHLGLQYTETETGGGIASNDRYETRPRQPSPAQPPSDHLPE